MLEAGEVLGMFCEHISQKAFWAFALFGRGKTVQTLESGNLLLSSFVAMKSH